MSDSGNRLLLLISKATIGGAERFDLLLLEHLPRFGYHLTVCVTDDAIDLWLNKYRNYTDDIVMLPAVHPFEDQPGLIRGLIESRQITVVLVTRSLLGYGLLPYLRSCFPNVAFLDYVHMVDLAWRDGGYARAAINQRHWLDLTLTSSGQVRHWLIEQGMEPGRAEICYINGDPVRWDPDKFDRQVLRRHWVATESEPIILYAARLTPQKRPHLLMEVITQLDTLNVDFVCLIAGEGPEYSWVERYIRQRGLENRVRLLGLVEPERMMEIMAACDIFFLPSQAEGIALTLYEAMAMRLAVVAAEVGGQAELLTPGTGILIPPQPDEARMYVENLKRLLVSPVERAALGETARARVIEHFNLEQMLTRLVALLHRAEELALTYPQQSVSAEEGRAAAAAAVTLARQHALAETLFTMQSSDWRLSQMGQSQRAWHRLAGVFKRRLLQPLYEWGLGLGFEWLMPAKNGLYQIIRRWMGRKV